MRIRQSENLPEEQGARQEALRDLYRLFGNGWGLLVVLCVSVGTAGAAGQWWSQLSMTEALKLAVTPLAVVVSMAIAALALIAQLFKDEAPSVALAERIGQTPLFGSALFLFISGMAAIGLVLVHVAVADAAKDTLLGSVTVAFVALVLLSASAHVIHLLGFLRDFLRGPNGTRLPDDAG